MFERVRTVYDPNWVHNVARATWANHGGITWLQQPAAGDVAEEEPTTTSAPLRIAHPSDAHRREKSRNDVKTRKELRSTPALSRFSAREPCR
jgi:hypothetical protein